MSTQSIWNYRLRNAPRPVKSLVLSFLLSLGLAYIYALANIALVVGLSPKDIARHYYGATEVVASAPKAAAPSGEQSFSLDDAPAKPAEAELGARPSFKSLVAEGHFHLFGMTSFFFCLTLLGLFTGFNERLKTVLVSLPFFTVILDNVSFMATRFLGPHYAFMTAIAGGLMGLSFTALWIGVGLEVLNSPEGSST